LSVTERSELLSALDKFSDVFRETHAGFCTLLEHTIPIMESFKPLTYITNKRVPECIPFHERKREAFNELKKLIIETVNSHLTSLI